METILSLFFNSKWLPSLPKKSADDSEQIKGPVACYASVAKLPIRIEDIEKVPAITEEIKVMLTSNSKIDAAYCYLSRLEISSGELTIGCNIKSTVCNYDPLKKNCYPILILAC
jgi:MscS family membrane protein